MGIADFSSYTEDLAFGCSIKGLNGHLKHSSIRTIQASVM